MLNKMATSTTNFQIIDASVMFVMVNYSFLGLN